MRRLLFWVLLILVILTTAALSSLPFLIRTDYIEGLINRSIKQQTSYTVTFDRFRVSFFPTPVVLVENVNLTPQKGADLPLVRAERLSLRPSVFSILIAKPVLAHGSAKGADIHYTWRDRNFVKTISFKDATIDFWNLASNKPIRFKIKGKFLSDSENVNIAGVFQSNFEHFKTKDLRSKIQIQIGPIELIHLADWCGTFPIHVERGTFGASVQVTKSEGTSNLEIKGTTKLDKLVYQVPPKPVTSMPGDYQVQLDAILDLDTGALEIKKGSMNAPFGGPFELDGNFNVFTGSLHELLFKTESLQLDMLPQYVLSVEKVLPVNLGFSGQTQLDFYVKGEPELFLLNLNVDFTNTSLAYSKYFSKPTGIPLTFKSGLKLAGGRALRGDFSLEFERASLKGSLVGLDLINGEGEVTILTNKFTVDGWQKYFPMLRQFELSGGVKILTSIKGDLNRLNEARIMNNLSLDSLQARAADGAEIRNLNGSFDSGPLDSELKDLKFEIGNTAFFAEGKMFQQPEPRWLINIHAPKIDMTDLASQIGKIAGAIDPEAKMRWNSIETNIRQFFSPAETVDEFELQLACEDKRFLIPEVKFLVFGGSVSGRGAFDQTQDIPTSFFETNIQRLNLSRMQSSRSQPIIFGNLFSSVNLIGKGPLDSGWLDRLQGKGSVSVTNGELHTLDLVGGLGQIAQLATLDSLKSGVTRFDDIRADFDILNQKITTQNAMLVSDDFQIEGQGDVGFDGNLNFRLSVYLSSALSRRISPQLGENARLGPIPILIVGPVSKPQIKQDPLLITSFLQSLVQEQFSKITSGFLPKNRQTPASTLPSSTSDQTLNQTQPKSKQSQNLDQQLVQSGFDLLEHFISQKKSANS